MGIRTIFTQVSYNSPPSIYSYIDTISSKKGNAKNS